MDDNITTNNVDAFYEFLSSLSEEMRIAYALFTAVGKPNDKVDCVNGFCRIIDEYRRIATLNDTPAGRATCRYYETVILKLDSAVSSHTPGASTTALMFQKFIDSIAAPTK